MRKPLPSSVGVHEVLETLAGSCRVEPLPVPGPLSGDVAMGYVSEYGEVCGLWELDMPLAVAVVAKMLVMPLDRVAEQSGEWAQAPLVDALLETGNILGTLANGPELPRLRIGPVWLRSAEGWRTLVVSPVVSGAGFTSAPPVAEGEAAAFAVTLGDAPSARAVFS